MACALTGNIFPLVPRLVPRGPSAAGPFHEFLSTTMSRTKREQSPASDAADPNDATSDSEVAVQPEPLDAADAATDAAGAAGGADPELDAARERHLRLAAEFDNYRRRTERERAESWTRAQAQLIERLLDPLDDLQRVAHVAPETSTTASVLDGVQMVERKVLRALESAGLERIEAEGQPFNPEIHEAITTAPTEDREADDTVAQVFQTGYRFKGALVRPARVQVNKFQS